MTCHQNNLSQVGLGSGNAQPGSGSASVAWLPRFGEVLLENPKRLQDITQASNKRLPVPVPNILPDKPLTSWHVAERVVFPAT